MAKINNINIKLSNTSIRMSALEYAKSKIKLENMEYSIQARKNSDKFNPYKQC